MADAAYDAIIVGAGNKGLVTAMYLAKYGGMDVALFEERNEAGGGWGSKESCAPGFIHDYCSTLHSAFHHVPLFEDFPDFKEKGGKLASHKGAGAIIFGEDHSCLVFYGEEHDPDQELTAKSIADFSERDAMTFLALWDRFSNVFRPAILEWLYNPPPMLGKMDPLEKVIADPASGVDPLWQEMSQMQVLDELFESTEVKTAALPHLISLFGIPPDMPGFGLYGILATVAWPLVRFVVGGSHSIAHAAISIIAENGGKLFNNSKVEKVLIENGKARGIRLADGSEVQARKVIVSNLNPQQLCFQLIGKEHLSSHILNRVSHLQSKMTAITWYGWALHEAPKYKAARFNSDINEAGWLALGGRDYDKLARDCGLLRAGRMPEDPPVTVWCHSLVDKTRAPEGKHIAGHACLSLPATALGEKEWIKFNKEHAAYVIKTWQEYAPNMSWDNVIGYDAITPYDVAKRLSNLDPEGNWAVIDSIKSQFGRNRPIPELARYRTPIANLYATGAAWPPAGMAFSSQGYCCYKVIAEDFELRKPWQEKGRPY